MTTTATSGQDRYRMNRAGVLNVWQYDEQVFDFADGRLLLRGTNGAGKSKTLEMLLPFVIDGDASRLTASGRHHTSLVWLLLDGYEGQARTGYVWLEFARTGEDGEPQTLTCGVGMRATASAKRASSWFFTSSRRVGEDLALDDSAGPLGQSALAAALEDDELGQVFDSARRYREHVGQILFGLPPEQYDSLLRLIYWLRQPQVGEDIDPRRLAEQLVNALPVLDSGTVSDAGATFDELEAFGEDLDRRERAALALTDFVQTYAGYARSVIADRGQAALDAASAVTGARRRVRGSERELEEVAQRLTSATEAIAAAEQERAGSQARRAALESGPEARSRDRLVELGRRAADLGSALERASTDVDQAAGRAVRSGDHADAGCTAVHRRTQALHRATGEAAGAASRAGARPGPAPTAAVLSSAPVWAAPADLATTQDQLAAAGETHTGWAAQVRTLVGQVKAAVQVVEEARRAGEAAQADARRAEESAEAVQSRTEAARALVTEAERAVRAAETELSEALGSWRSDPVAVPLELPELSRDGLAGLESFVAAAAAPRQAEVGRSLAAAEQQESAARTLLADLRERRAAVDREVDPAPAPPPWRRDARDELPGAPLWRLVDFREDVPASDRARLEAALEGAGLLDAWVTPGGALLDGDRQDVVLTAAARTGAGEDRDGLGAVLAPDPDASDLVAPEVVVRVLRRVGLLDDGASAQGVPVAVSTVGAWVVGPAHGRTSKDTAQFIGASARAAERARRAAELDALIAEQETGRDAAAAAAQAARDLLAALQAWLAARPRHDRVLAAWAREESDREHLERAETELRAALDRAREARERAAARHTELVALAQRHDLPVTAQELDARRELARSAEEALSGLERAAAALTGELATWRERAERAREDAEQLDARRSAHERAGAAWQPVHAEHEELAAAAGAEIADLERRITELRRAEEAAAAEQAAQARSRDALLTAQGTVEGRLDGERAALADAEPRREEAFEALRALHAIPGLVASADVGADPDRPPADRDEVKELVGRSGSGHRTSNEVLQAMTALQSGPASTHEPRLVQTGPGDVFAAVARDDSAGDQPVARLAEVLSTRVATDRELLTERERDLFETHVLSQLGDALRGVRRQAEELVAAMNDQLTTVTTSQGIRVRLRWRLREDIPTDARRAVELLGQPLGALLPDERTELREALHRLIDLSRSEAPEDSYAEHLERALDYRQWFAFTVQYLRPEVQQWRDLHRKSALSQGEQKVLCYLPLFAAAAAHFTSLAGAAPHAPRFVLLDDAFPKIDARTHPRLFGLLVDLDLDFVMTSERLWGTHASVPSLAIYEALRSPAQRGIAQFEHRWDGQQLTAVGAH
ncbi:TIGR02680 family protein [Ornithinimicrobium avium]|uniref:TIGR02680 family protein n=1 Tax=Ornithinimicrobium avium TaxID=2283195 RepID=A0A345NLY5_9MICO|nr:TIGR02680 family protein [Ornithinimicrobium avium]AXH96043.1 TIGR02680 family protein [Ornithinimicrobium avium]